MQPCSNPEVNLTSDSKEAQESQTSESRLLMVWKYGKEEGGENGSVSGNRGTLG